MSIIKNIDEWKKYICFWADIDDRGTGIKTLDGYHSFVNSYIPKEFPFIIISGEWKEGCDFDYQKFYIIYPSDLKKLEQHTIADTLKGK